MTDATIQEQVAGIPENSGIDQSGTTVEADAPLVTPTEGGPTLVKPATREVILRVPVSVPDARIQLAMDIGNDAITATQKGVLMMLFPTSDPQSGEPMLGRAVVPLLSQKDLDLLLSLAKVIGETNMKAIEKVQSQGPVVAMAAEQDANLAKENAARDLAAKAQGRSGGIILAR